MKDYINIRIRLVLVVLIIIVFVITFKNADLSVKNFADAFLKSINNQVGFFKYLFTGSILYTPSGITIFKYFISLIIIFFPGFMILYGNNILKVKDDNKHIFIIFYSIMGLAFIYFAGTMFVMNIFELRVPEIWMLKNVILAENIKNFNVLLKYLSNNIADIFKMKNWFLFNILAFSGCLFRVIFKIKTPSFASFTTSVFFEILRLSFLIGLIKYASFLMIIRIQI